MQPREIESEDELRVVKRRLGILAAIIVLTLGGGFLYHMTGTSKDQAGAKAKAKLSLDPAEVRQTADKLLPGVVPPAGYSWVTGIAREDWKLEAAVLAKSAKEAAYTELSPDGLRFTFVGMDISDKLPADQRLDAFTKFAFLSREKRGWKVISRDSETLKVNGQARPGLRSVVKGPAGKVTFIEHSVLFINGSRMVLLVVNGPEKTFNTTLMQKFLDSLSPPDQKA